MERRRLYWHGYLFLLIAFAMGMMTAAGVPPGGAEWMKAHVGIMVGSVLMLAAASAWNELKLSAGQQKWAFRLFLAASYGGLALNVASTVLPIPGPASHPGAQLDGTQTAALLSCLAFIIPGYFGSGALFLYGMRGRRE